MSCICGRVRRSVGRAVQGADRSGSRQMSEARGDEEEERWDGGCAAMQESKAIVDALRSTAQHSTAHAFWQRAACRDTRSSRFCPLPTLSHTQSQPSTTAKCAAARTAQPSTAQRTTRHDTAQAPNATPTNSSIHPSPAQAKLMSLLVFTTEGLHLCFACPVPACLPASLPAPGSARNMSARRRQRRRPPGSVVSTAQSCTVLAGSRRACMDGRCSGCKPATSGTPAACLPSAVAC